MSTKGNMLMSESVMPPEAAAAGAVWAIAEEINTENSRLMNEEEPHKWPMTCTERFKSWINRDCMRVPGRPRVNADKLKWSSKGLIFEPCIVLGDSLPTVKAD
jgi:hypothetical protein